MLNFRRDAEIAARLQDLKSVIQQVTSGIGIAQLADVERSIERT
jgi:hypothetical protein